MNPGPADDPVEADNVEEKHISIDGRDCWIYNQMKPNEEKQIYLTKIYQNIFLIIYRNKQSTTKFEYG